MKKRTKELILENAIKWRQRRQENKVLAGSGKVMTSQERQTFLKESEYGRLVGFAEKL